MSFIAVAKGFFQMVSGELDPHTSQKSKVKVNPSGSVSLWTAKHIHFAKYGRAAGKPPPIDEMMKWVSQKGIIFPNTTLKGTAFLIARSIGKNGTKNYVANAPDALTEALQKHQKAYFIALAADHKRRERARIQREMEKAYKQNKYK
jgi:hypothetical protein